MIHTDLQTPPFWTSADDADVRALIRDGRWAVIEADDERAAMVRASYLLSWGNKPRVVVRLLAEWLDRQEWQQTLAAVDAAAGYVAETLAAFRGEVPA